MTDARSVRAETERIRACVRRSRSNTPIQALMTLNETMAMEAARSLARRALADGGPTDADRVTYAFRRCLSRPPAVAV